MLLAIDISNTNIKFGLYNSVTMKHHWIVSTARQRTTDEYAMVLFNLADHTGYQLTDLDDIILSLVVAALTPVYQKLALRYFNKQSIVVDSLLYIALKMLFD